MTTMADKQTDKCIPKLRFPEFKNDGEWKTFPLEELFEIRNGYTPSKSNPDFWEGGTIPWFRMEDIRQNGHILSDSIQHITPQAIKGAGLFPAYSIIVATTATIGEHALIIADSLANQRFTFLTKRKSHDEEIDMMYFHQYMFIIDEWCKRNTNSGGLLSVNMSAFKRLLVPLPSIKEQKKIASCLSSLDECITASKEKLVRLKAHKKGLMQKLFPAPGKTTPECRLPKYKDNDAWKLYKLGKLLKVNSGKDYKHLEPGDIPVYGTGGYMTSVNGILSSVNAVGIGRKGTIDKPQFLRAPFWTVDTLFYLTSLGEIDILFFYYLAQMISWKKYGEQTGVPSLSKVSIEDLEICIPSKLEQCKIASFLSSLDELIKREEERISFLSFQKQGLLHELF